MRHLLAAGLRWLWQTLRQTLWQNPALRQAFCPRHIGAGATSLGIHAFVVGAVIWLSAPVLGVGLGAAAGAKRTTRIVALFPLSAANANAAAGSERPSAKPLMQASKEASGPVKEGIKMEPGEGKLEFPDFTFDVEKLAGRGTALFPFLTRTISFNVEKPREKRKAPLFNPFAEQPALSMDATPLVMTDAEVQRIVDEAWARRERWVPFQRIRTLVDQHHPDVGQVPALLRGHVEQNALQPYMDTKMRDPRLWTQLALVADHELFIDFIADYVSRHPGTKASIELLFLLDVLAQGSLDTLTLFLEIEPDRDLKWTRRTNPAAFSTIVKIRDYYLMQREIRGLESHRAIGRHYDQIRTRILTTIMQTAPGGYRVNDARYLLGELHWRRDRFAEAKQVWREMRADPDGLYAEASSSVLVAMREAEERGKVMPPPPTPPTPSPGRRRVSTFTSPDTINLQAEVRAINGILEAEYQRWVNFYRARLRHFGYALDAF
jgi:hypothetical protein